MRGSGPSPAPPAASRRPVSAAAAALLVATLAAGALHASRPAGPAELPEQRIDVNSASVDRLRLLPRVGPKLAEAIVRDREARGPFVSLEDLDRVPRIGPRTLLAIEPDASLGP